MVGSRFIEVFNRNYEIVAPTIEELDFLNFPETWDLIKKESPSVIINFAAITDVEGAEGDKDNLEGAVYRVNALAVKNLSEIATELGIHLIQISTEYIFDGQKENPYTEEDKPNPINWYGSTKLFAEQFVQDSGCDFTILRISMPFSSHFELKKDIARRFVELLQNNQEIKVITNSDITPIFVDDIAEALSKIIEGRTLGIYHAVSTDSTTPYKFARLIAETFNLDESKILKTTLDEYNREKQAKLLRHSWLSSEKFISKFGQEILHTVEDSVKMFKEQIDSLK